MRILQAVVASLLFVSSGAAQPVAIDRATAALKNVEANFTHKFTPKGFKNAQIESGTVIFGALPAMRWSYQKPEPKLFVFDGTRSWFYVPDDRQVTVADIDDRRRADLPFLFLGDPVARDRHFVVKEQKRGSGVVTTLQPRSRSAAVRGVSIVTTATNLIESVEYSDRDGNRTIFTFSGYHPARISAETFRFATPAGVQVIRAD
ncbi:MAG: outer membrane lipoprotein carrier protein LolA [Thermoanaerobaculia bacterium]|nr:outer membrane lipoprotein carrier protein LolA [Thermoanaerobaculia bacterium]